MKNFNLSVVQEKLINVHYFWLSHGHLSFQVKELFAGVGKIFCEKVHENTMTSSLEKTDPE